MYRTNQAPKSQALRKHHDHGGDVVYKQTPQVVHTRQQVHMPRLGIEPDHLDLINECVMLPTELLIRHIRPIVCEASNCWRRVEAACLSVRRITHTKTTRQSKRAGTTKRPYLGHLMIQPIPQIHLENADSFHAYVERNGSGVELRTLD